MSEEGLDDGVVHLRAWMEDDAAWYARSVQDELIQQFTTESPTLRAEQVRAAIIRLRASAREEGFIICDAVTGDRLGNIAVRHDGIAGEISYWVAAEARGRGVGTRALVAFSAWSFQALGLDVLWLRTHRDNVGSQRVALRAGYQPDPDRDCLKQVKGAEWRMLGFTLTRPRASIEAEAIGR